MVPKHTSHKQFDLIVSLCAVVIIVLCLFAPTVSSRSATLEHDLGRHFVEFSSLQLDAQTASKQVRDTGRLSLATSEMTFDLELVPHDLRAPGYRAEEFGPDGVARVIDVGPVHTYKGRALGSERGIRLPVGKARFTIDETKLEGLIITPTGHYFVEPARKYSDAAIATDYIIYRESNVMTGRSGECGVTLSEEVNQKAEAVRTKNASTISPILPQSTQQSSLVATPASPGCGVESITSGQQLHRNLRPGCAFEGGQLTDIYSFSGKAGQEVVIHMTSNAFDTQLYLYYGPVNALTIAAQDNNGGGGTNSRIPPGSGTLTLPATNTYYIYATSVLPNQTGNYSISFSLTTPVSANDNFANAQLIPGINGSVSGITLSATKETGEPNHAGNAGGASIWYRWQAPANGHENFVTTLSDFDTLLAVYAGDTLTSLVPIASNNDADGTLQSNVTFATKAGRVYYIAVDGVNGATGRVMLSFGPSGPLEDANDAFANATQISGPLGTAFGGNRFATKELGEPNHAGNAGGASIWYRWEAPVTGRFAFSTAGSDFDTLLAAYTGSTVTSLIVIASNNNDPADGSQSKVEFNAASGTVYYLALDGFNSARGNSTLVWAPSHSTPTPSPTPIPTPTARLLQELRIATEADNEYVMSNGGPAASSQAILSTLNQVEGLFEVELGLTFRVVYQSAWNTSNDPFSSTNPTVLLGELSNHWNANRGSVARDLVHMWTGKQMDNSTIGTAYLEALCRFAGNGRAAYGLSTGVLNKTQQIAIAAHEIGHNLGATHPNQQAPPVTECNNSVMSSSVNTEPQFTFCEFSREEIARYLASSAGCLSNGSSGLKFAFGGRFFFGESPNAMVSVDFNGDGKEDLATANESGNVTVLLGSDDGTLHEATGSPFVVGSVPTSIVAVDLNRDGANDLAVASSNGQVSVFLGTGGGSFVNGPGSPLSAGLSPSAIAAADFNGDGLQDLAISNGGGDDVSVFQGTGDGGFLPRRNHVVTPDPSYITTGDFNRDGNQDFAVTSGLQRFVTVLLSAGAAGFQERVSYSVGNSPHHSVMARDFTGDGVLDLLVLQGGNFSELHILNGVGDGTFQASTVPPIFFTPSSQPKSLVTADFDGDGILDLAISFLDTDLVGRVSAHVLLLMGRGDGSFASPQTIVVDSPSSVTAGDLNGDGNVDLVTATDNGVNVLPGNDVGIFQDVGNFPIGKNPNGSMTVGDFDSDGVLDIALIDRNEELDGRVVVVPGGGTGVSYLRALFNVQLLTAGDFNGDGALDVAITVPNLPFDDVRLLMGNNTGSLTLAGATTAGGFTRDISAADFNSDGRDDVVVATDESINILFGMSGGLQTPVRVATDSFQTIKIGDFNNDRKIDMVTRGRLLLGNGDGSFHTVVNANIDSAITPGDFNGDGKLDLIQFGKFLKGNGDGTFQMFDGPGFGGGGLAADFNGDGKLDLANPGVSVQLGNGDGSFQMPLLFPLGLSTSGLVAGDFDGDNKIDLATTSRFTNQFGGIGMLNRLWNITGSSLNAPSNDLFNLARTIRGPSGTLAGTTILATVEASEPNHASASNGTGGASIWYRWTAPSSGKFYFQTLSSSFSNVIAVYTGADLGALTPVVKSTVNVPEYVEINATAGTTYQIAIDGVTGDTGRTVLTWNTGSLSNDNFAFAREIRGSNGNVNGDNTNFTLEPNEPTLTGPGNTGFSAWYRWTAPNSGKVSFATTPCGDTTRLLGAHTGNFLNLLTPVAVNFDGYRDFDDPGGCDNRTLRFNAVAGTTYRIQLRSVTGAPFKLEWNYANPPPNDNFTNALVLAGNSGSLLGTNRDATKESGELNHAGGPGGASIWYRWTAPTNGQVTFDTFGFRNQTSNSFRYLTALMAVYTGTSLNNLTSVVTNATDNRVTFNATSGTTYHIAIDSGPYDGGGYLPGIVPLHWGARQVANDDFIHAQPLTVASTFTPVLGSNVGATKEPGEPNHAGSTGGTSVWYRWTALSSDDVSFIVRACITCTLSTNNTLVGIYTGASVNALTAVPATADNNHTFSAIRGRTYFIAVDSNAAAGGKFEFSLVSSNISARNDNFSSAQVLSGNNGVVAGDNSGATEEPGEPDHANDRGGSSVWYQWKAPASGLYTIDTFGSNFDTLLAVYTGNDVNALSVVANSDNANSSPQSRLTFDAKVDTTYFIAVDGKSTGIELGSGLTHSQAGFILLNWNNLPPPVNDKFTSAEVITGASGNITGRNSVASKEGGEPNHAGSPGGASVWYQWTAPSSGNFAFNTFGSEFNTLLAVYTGTAVNNLTAVSSNDNIGGLQQSRVTFNAAAGTVYNIAVDGSPGIPGNVTPFSGNLVLSWFPETGVSNNHFLSAQLLNGTSGSLAATNAGATKESGEPNHAGDRGGRSVWYSWTAPFSGPVLFTTSGSDFDTVLAAYTGTTVNQLTAVASNDDSPYADNLGHILTSSLTFTAMAGTTYRIAVDGSGGRLGNFALRWGPDATISGQVSFLGGICGSDKKVTMLLSGEDTRAVTFTGSGTFTFQHLRVGGNYSVRGISEISASCLPLFLERVQNFFPLAGDVLDANFVDDGLRGGGSTSNITGHVQNTTGVGLHNVAIALSGTASRTVYTDNAGLYLLPNLPAGTYQVTPSKEGTVFTPTSREFTFTSGQTITDADFATQNSFNISGQTRAQNGSALNGAIISLNNGTHAVSVQTDANGYYAFDAAAGGSYTLTAAKAGLSFTPTSQSIPSLNANTKNIDFTVTQLFTLTIASTNPGTGVSIAVSPNDSNGQANGSTQFARSYSANTTVNLTAPTTASGNNFQKWLKNGADFSTNPSTSVTMDAHHTLTAVYVTPTRTLTVASANPSSGVTITVTPNDNSNLAGGSTQFTRTYNLNSTITLTAPAIAGGNSFQKWLKNGADFSTNPSTSVTMDANHTLTAVYVTPTRTLTVASANPSSGVTITVTPNDNSNLGSGPTQFTRTYNLNSTVTLTAPATAGGNNFQKWLKNGADFSSNISTSVTMDSNHTLTAVYLTTDAQTPAGQNVVVQLNGVKLTFTNVTGAGTTNITPINPSAAGPLPNGYQMTGDSVAFDISTTATVQPPISVCFNLPLFTDASVFGQLRLLHTENGVLVDRTANIDFSNKVICATVNSLSPFVLASSSLPLLQLLLEESGAISAQAAALDAILLLRDPFPVVNPNNLFSFGTDRNTRVLLFVKNLQLQTGETAAVVTVNLVDNSGHSYNIAAEGLRTMPLFEFSQLTFRLPDGLAPGSCTVQIKAHGQVSNVGTMRITQ